MLLGCSSFYYKAFVGAYGILFLLFFSLLAALPEEQVRHTCEVGLHDEAQSLRVEAVASEVSVVCLVVDIDGEVAVREQQILHVEVADEVVGCVRVVAIAELSVQEQAVVEQFSREYAFVLGVVEAFGARRYVCTEVPVVVVYDAAQQTVYLLADGSAMSG